MDCWTRVGSWKRRTSIQSTEFQPWCYSSSVGKGSSFQGWQWSHCMSLCKSIELQHVFPTMFRNVLEVNPPRAKPVNLLGEYMRGDLSKLGPDTKSTNYGRKKISKLWNLSRYETFTLQKTISKMQKQTRDHEKIYASYQCLCVCIYTTLTFNITKTTQFFLWVREQNISPKKLYSWLISTQKDGQLH